MQGKERPMLYSTDMVMAIMENRKTKTRRMKGLELMNENPDNWELEEVGTLEWESYDGKPDPTMKSMFGASFLNVEYGSRNFQKCPYGQPGDILWVRETWALEKYFNGLTEECFPIFKAAYDGPVAWDWKPSIHMRKVYARIWLEITDIKVERLQTISNEDAIAEGIDTCQKDPVGNGGWRDYTGLTGRSFEPFWSFNSLWCRINGKDSWDLNPWVWVVSFKVLLTTGRPEFLTIEKEVSRTSSTAASTR